MQQLSIFHTLPRPPIRVPVDPYGPVLKDEPDFVYTLAHARMAWNRAEIEIHRHENGLWMWSTEWNCDNGGRGYRVGAKWGKFAETHEDALFYAASETKTRFGTNPARTRC
ncbi:hypothetical protein GOC81_22860 [Sinorhizobium medicae]|nr:hypothetical protein [Sinorhizobium medicae]MDX0573776.1 hypothetical protein [Sinorhizobium medicae]MDX0672574.1 hypothetical protein [Sinorhizobium medicae]MDX0709889.1 hypothetical protein [Sinorhizobium medicae]